MLTQAEKGRAFRALHERSGAFIIPNPWDIGTARLLAHLGFEALATTSMGYAFSIGRRDNSLDRQETLAHAAMIASATNLAVSADLENGFGDAPEFVAETIRLAAAAGVVGGSIEDAKGRRANPIYDRQHAVDRSRKEDRQGGLGANWHNAWSRRSLEHSAGAKCWTATF